MQSFGHVKETLLIQSPRVSSSNEKPKKHPKKTVKRGKRKSKKNQNTSNSKLTIIGANAAGLYNKIESLKRITSFFNPGAIMLQETKARRKGKLKLLNYEIFENIRSESGGGGLLTAVHQSLEPFDVGECVDGEELLTVEVKIDK